MIDCPGILDHFTVVLLDMNGTFMFGEDRFGPDHGYAATYRALGGSLRAERVRRLVQGCCDRLAELYPDPAYYECFPSVRETLRRLPDAAGLDDAELGRLERTFATRELGRVPPDYAAAIRRLAATRRLGLVADVWSEKGPWVDELQRAGLGDVFEVTVFSSETGSVKPSPHPFRLAVEQMGVRPEACVYVGDSVRRDVRGAKSAGLATVWIGKGDTPAEADWVVPSLLALC